MRLSPHAATSHGPGCDGEEQPADQRADGGTGKNDSKRCNSGPCVKVRSAEQDTDNQAQCDATGQPVASVLSQGRLRRLYAAFQCS